MNSQRFLQRFKTAVTTRRDGTSWPRRRNTWKNAVGYFRALARGGKGKSMTHIATHMNVRRQRVERFVRESPWTPDAVEQELNDHPPKAFQGPDAALILDGMGVPKKGRHSVGVARQWCGATGKIDNCQVVVNLTLARPGKPRNKDQVTWPLGSHLYLPKAWAGVEGAYKTPQEKAEYADLRRDARVPDDVVFRTKSEIGLALIERALDAGVRHGCVVADANFGRDGGFRKQLRAWEEPYVVGVKPGDLRVIPATTPIEAPGPQEGPGPGATHPRYPEGVQPASPKEIADRVDEADAWEDIVFAEGTKGELSGRFYVERVRTVEKVQHRWVFEEVAWLVLEQRDGELKAYLCWGLDRATGASSMDAPAELSLQELAEVAHLRWTVERFHQDIKDTLGADEFQGRTWGGFHRHMAMVLLAHAFVATLRVEQGEREGLPSFEEVVRRVTRERGVQALMRDEGVGREVAERLVDRLLREWFAR